MGLGLAGNTYERHMGVVCCSQELAGPGGDSLFLIKASNATALKIQKMLSVQRSARQRVS